MKSRIVLILITLLCAAMASVQSASVAIIVVTNINDSGPGSLRQALVDANDGDTINFDPSLKGQTITLTSGHLNVDKDVTISGPGADNLAVDGNAQSLVFNVNLVKTVTMFGLTITNGNGGGIFNLDGGLTVSNCTVSGNYGGGIFNYGSRFGAAELSVNDSIISGNYGSGISNFADHSAATLTITNSTISGNLAEHAGGGGIASGSGKLSRSIVTVSNSTISGNSADYGGGIYNGSSNGGIISGVTVSNSTLSGNSASVSGGGIYNGNGGGSATLELSNTILNTGSSGGNIFNDGGTVTSHGYNLSSDNGGGYLTGTGDQINTDPLLGPLQDNGGPTFTHALLPGSPAINAGDPSFTPPPFYDQRGPGFDRIATGRIDIGSFEVQAKTTPTPTPCDGGWVERSPVPYNAGGIFAASDGTFVYAGGGADLAKSTFHKDLLKYDPVNDSWTPLAPSPDYHYHSQAVYFNRKIYNIGGYNENLPEVTDTTRIYNIDTNTWTTGAPMPQALAQMATVLWNGVIYIAGGNNSTSRVSTLYAYDIASNTWTTDLAPMPQAVTLAGFGVIDGRLYVAGGSTDAGYSDTLYVYDIATHSWSTEASLRQPIARPGSSVLNGLLYLYGGRLSDLTPTTITQIYDPSSHAWKIGPDMNVPLFSSYGTAIGNDSILAPGGLDANFVGLIDNEQLINIACSSPTPTPTPTVTPTATPTATATPTLTPTATPTPTTSATPMPRASTTPRPRPTPVPRP